MQLQWRQLKKDLIELKFYKKIKLKYGAEAKLNAQPLKHNGGEGWRN